MVWVGRDLKYHLAPTPLPWAGTSSTRQGCSKSLLVHASLLAGIFYLPLPVTPGVLITREAPLHEKKQAVNRQLVHSLNRQVLLIPDKMLSYSKGEMGLLLHTLQISSWTPNK